MADDQQVARAAFRIGSHDRTLNPYMAAARTDRGSFQRDLLPGNGRRIGIWLDAAGVQLERAGIWLQAQAGELRWRRISAWRRWGS